MSCAVKNCSNDKNNSPEIHFFTAPKNVESRRKWLHRCGMYAENPMPEKLKKKKLYVCENHFDANDYRIVLVNPEKSNRYILDPNILPHKNLPQYSGVQYSFLDNENDPLDISSVVPDDLVHTDETFDDSSFLELPKRPKLSDASFRLNSQQSLKSRTDRCVATDKVLHATVSVQCAVEMKNKGVQTSYNCLPLRTPPGTPSTITRTSVGSDNSVERSVGSLYTPSHESLNGTASSFRDAHYHIARMKLKPMNYLGVSEDNLFIINALSETTGLSERDIMLVFRKIRLNEPFEILCDTVGLTGARVGQIFSASVPLIAREMKELIFWPEGREIKKFLPVSFLNKYYSVQSIIDCFEVQIQKPTSPVLQSVTYSQYKSCNTLKYLVSCAPCGLVTFVSKGFPGRASDQRIVRKSGYLDKITPGAGVLADRGFKNVASDVANVGGNLIRPPSVSNDEPLSKEEAIQAKEIASVRIHVERLIRRFREYRMCAPHAELPSTLFNKLDDIVIIIAGLVNLQGKLIK